tara:strand:- start:2550 stop:2957 length:408 start_codon:yes stop_codon:yes gene_type:complete
MVDSENGEIPKEVTEEFVEVVKNWVKIDDEIRKKNQEVKELKDERKEFEMFIIEYMDKINENVINISDGKLRKNKSASKGSLKQDSIQNALLDITQDSSKAMQMTKYIMDSRPVVERVNLKRTKKRDKKPKKKDI